MDEIDIRENTVENGVENSAEAALELSGNQGCCSAVTSGLGGSSQDYICTTPESLLVHQRKYSYNTSLTPSKSKSAQRKKNREGIADKDNKGGGGWSKKERERLMKHRNKITWTACFFIGPLYHLDYKKP